MTLFSYEIFDAVARQGSFNKAAQQLHLTPSAISHAIAVMEAELGFTLFNRGKNGVTMTSYGASLYPSIRAVLNSDEALQQSIARLNGLEKGKVKLGAFNSICSGLLPSILKGFMAHYPQIEVEVYQGTYDDVKEWLRTGQVDIAFLSNNCREEFVLTELFHEPLLCITPMDWPESNIFSIISSGDAVARVLPAAWGYHRNGCDRFLPATRNAEELADLDALGAEFGPTPLVVSSLATAEDTSALIDIVAKFCVSRENFHQKYETAIMDMIQCAFIRSEKEVVDGYILSDGEIVERLQTLSHMKEIDYWQIVGSVWAASTMSRPILERYGQNVPLLARQILIPVLAVGLCYGIETDVVQMVAQYIIRLLTARGELDSVLRAAFCHHPENYISLMEYYTPEEHGMEPFTRR